MQRVKKYLQYKIKAKGSHGVHSPFVFALLQEVLNKKKKYYPFAEIEKRRKNLLSNSTRIEVNDYGAGSKFSKSGYRKVSNIAAHSLKSPKYAQLLFRLCNHCRYQKVLELGTSLGITTAYLAASGAQVVTLEGCGESIRIAEKGLRLLGYQNRCTLVEGPFENAIAHPAVLGSKEGALDTTEGIQHHYDLIFIDGHHEGTALLDYAYKLIPSLNAGGCLVIDDIHWSNDMYDAWQALQRHESFNLSIDLFEMGLLFNKPEMVRQAHVLSY